MSTEVKAESDEQMADNQSDSGVESSSNSASGSSSNTSIDQIQCPRDDTHRVRELFYGRASDVTLKFPNGTRINVNKFPLAAKSQVFSKIFYDDLTHVRFVSLNEDSDAFKLFLNCLMGFEKCTKTNISTVLPLALKYEVVELVEKWTEMLKPECLNDEFFLTLNLAIKHDCQQLLIQLMEFLTNDGKINKIFDDEKNYNLLEPCSIRKLLDYVKMDSFILETIFKWAEYYLMKKGKSVDFKKFFEKIKIIDKINLNCFETSSAILNFNDSELARKYFTAEEILAHVRITGLNECKSEWVRVEGGVEIEENFKLCNWVKLNGYNSLCVVYRNPVVFYNIPKDKKNMMSWSILCTINSEILIFSEDKLDFNISEDTVAAVVRINENNAEFINIKIKWKFNYDCRILRTSPIFLNDKENVCYTKKIVYMYEKDGDIFKIRE